MDSNASQFGDRQGRWEPGPVWVRRRALDRGEILKASAVFLVGAYGIAGSGWPVLLLALLSGCLAAMRMRSPLSRRCEDLSALYDDPCPVAPFWVDVAIRRDGALIGVDTGVVTFVDGWLHYSGLETSFSLWSSRCARIAPIEPWSSRRGQTDYAVGLHLQGTSIDVSLRSRGDKTIEGMAGSWFADRRPPVPMVLPPSNPQRRATMGQVQSLATGLVSIAAATTIYAGLLWSMEAGKFSLPILLPLTILFAACTYLWTGTRMVTGALRSMWVMRRFDTARQTEPNGALSVAWQSAAAGALPRTEAEEPLKPLS